MTHADICLLLEGTYPYVTGGVSTWTHDLLLAHHDLKFSLVTFLPPNYDQKLKYKIPKNVVDIQHVYIQELKEGDNSLSKKKRDALFQQLEGYLLNLQYKGDIRDLEGIIHLFKETGIELGNEILMLSDDAWRMLVRMYSASAGTSSFLDFFWSWRGLIGGLYSILLAPMPKASVYHALCTGYAGMFLARAHLETGRPSIITEHGIYTNERRIEIASADWIEESIAINLSIDKQRKERGLKDLWIDTFASYSKICYQASEKIITLHAGNQPLQISDGANPEKMMLIANGIDVESFAKLPRKSSSPLTIALIGRVVPIKDIKTFIRAVFYLHKALPDLQAYVLGPTDEDPYYFQECLELVDHLHLQLVLHFPGKVETKEWLSKIDLMVLTSISESQPLTLLEAGACGIPSVATNVGACYEILYGRKDENPPLGEGGLIAPLANPEEIAKEIERLLIDRDLYERCSTVIKERVHTYYRKEIQKKAYEKLYHHLMREPTLFKEV